MSEKLNETEIDYRKAFEEVTTKNVDTMIEYCRETRDLNYKLEKKVDALQNTIMGYDSVMKDLRLQLVTIQAKLYAGGI